MPSTHRGDPVGDNHANTNPSIPQGMHPHDFKKRSKFGANAQRPVDWGNSVAFNDLGPSENVSVSGKFDVDGEEHTASVYTTGPGAQQSSDGYARGGYVAYVSGPGEEEVRTTSTPRRAQIAAEALANRKRQ